MRPSGFPSPESRAEVCGFKRTYEMNYGIGSCIYAIDFSSIMATIHIDILSLTADHWDSQMIGLIGFSLDPYRDVCFCL